VARLLQLTTGPKQFRYMVATGFVLRGKAEVCKEGDGLARLHQAVCFGPVGVQGERAECPTPERRLNRPRFHCAARADNP